MCLAAAFERSMGGDVAEDCDDDAIESADNDGVERSAEGLSS